jgi:hypothetical protein
MDCQVLKYVQVNKVHVVIDQNRNSSIMDDTAILGNTYHSQWYMYHDPIMTLPNVQEGVEKIPRKIPEDQVHKCNFLL